MDIQTLLLFMTASTLLAIAPGPDNLFVLTQSMAKGRKAGIVITLGLCSGLIFHTSAVALGVAVIFQTSALAFNALKYIGAGYLLYLAYLSFKDAKKTKLKIDSMPTRYSSLYKRGIFMNVTNPKVSIFFLAFLPQFTHPQVGNVTAQVLLLGALFMFCTLIVFSLIALLAGTLGSWFTKTKNGESILNKVAGSIFAVLAIKLALSER